MEISGWGASLQWPLEGGPRLLLIQLWGSQMSPSLMPVCDLCG